MCRVCTRENKEEDSPRAAAARRSGHELRAGRVLGAPPRPQAPCAANGEQQQQHVGRAAAARRASSAKTACSAHRVPSPRAPRLRAPRAAKAVSSARCPGRVLRRPRALGVKRRPSHARCALLLRHDVTMTIYTLLFF